jgi:hypothetical protein
MFPGTHFRHVVSTSNSIQTPSMLLLRTSAPCYYQAIVCCAFLGVFSPFARCWQIIAHCPLSADPIHCFLLGIKWILTNRYVTSFDCEFTDHIRSLPLPLLCLRNGTRGLPRYVIRSPGLLISGNMRCEPGTFQGNGKAQAAAKIDRCSRRPLSGCYNTTRFHALTSEGPRSPLCRDPIMAGLGPTGSGYCSDNSDVEAKDRCGRPHLIRPSPATPSQYFVCPSCVLALEVLCSSKYQPRSEPTEWNVRDARCHSLVPK